MALRDFADASYDEDPEEGERQLGLLPSRRPLASTARPPRNNGLSRVLSVSDLAARWDCSRHTARIRLLRADRESGGKIARRWGRAWYTTEALARQAETGWVEEQAYARDEIAELKKKNARLENDLRLVKSHFKRVEAALREATAMVRQGSLGIEPAADS